MLKHRAGLHKDVSEIFDGVPIPGQDAPHFSGTVHTSSLKGSDYDRQPKSKTPAPSHLTSTASTAQQLKADTAEKTARQTPKRQSWQRIKTGLFTPKPGISSARHKTTAALVPVLFIVLIFVLVKVFIIPSFMMAGTATEPEPEDAEFIGDTGIKIDWQIPDPYPTTLRDPMQFGSVTTTTAIGTSEIIVKGIVYSEDNPCAVIGTQIAHEGDRVGNAIVIRINKDSVEFETDGKRWIQTVQHIKQDK